MRKYLLTLLLISLTYMSIGQTYSVTKRGLISKIFDFENKNIAIQNQQRFKQNLFELDYNNDFCFLRNKNGSFVIPNGTGRIYKAFDKKNDTILYKRIDSTQFSGYNNEAILFTYRDTIFSFGGYGFWRTNGQLRYFSEKFNEWDIIPLNEEVPTLNTLYFFDSLNGDLYYLQIPLNNYATNKSTNAYLLYKLNLPSKINILLGKISENFKQQFPVGLTYSFTQINSLNCVLINFNINNQFLIDFKNNQTYELKNINTQKVFYGNSKDVKSINAFELNKWLYFTRSNDPTMQLDSVRITMDDFTPLGIPFYEPESNKQNLFAGISLGLLIVSGASIYFYRRKRKKETRTENSNEEIEIDGFKLIEMNLIEKIYKKTADGKSYSVEDINTALGLSKKSLEIQKKIRTETINRINHRFKLKFNTEEDLIERIRLEEDRRFYKYIINEENGKKALGI